MKKIKILLLSVLLLFPVFRSTAKVIHLLPRPQKIIIDPSQQPFLLNRSIVLTDPTSCKLLERFFVENGCTIDPAATAKVTVRLVESISGAHDYQLAGFDNEAYTLSVETDRITITAVTSIGVIRAAQTLAQLAEGYDNDHAKIEVLTLEDWPAFKLRGLMHDVGRSYIDIEELKKEIDLFARFKVNVFQWHLTENQAWRFEIKAYPALTSRTSMTRFPGKYYTQEECRMLEDYAAERGVTIIPEIDMPGHSSAFERAMGHSMQTDQGVEELKQVLTEVAQVFIRAPYIHVGADEQTITYPNFLGIITDKVHELGKRAVVWNPIRGVTISKDAGFDMTQMWSTSGRKVAGIPNIDCRYNYINHFDVFADLIGIYKSNIYYQTKGSDEVAGFITAPWNDRKTPTQTDIIRQNNLYANLLASAERAWIGGGKQYIETGGTTLPNSGEEYEEFLNWENRFLFHKSHSLKNEPIPYVRQSNIRWRITEAFPNNGNSEAVFPPETADENILPSSFTYGGKTYDCGIATGAAIYLRHTWGSTVPAYYSNPQLNTTAYAWTYIYSEEEQTVGANIEFQNYGRSENDKAPDAGKWDRKGSRIWLNGVEIMPPVWKNTGKSISAEVDLLNENFTARSPIPIKLEKGWNKVFLKLPYVSADGVRLNKWLFTFVLTDLEGVDAVEGLIYSPNQCLDADAEQVSATISEIEKALSSIIKDAPGYYALDCAKDLLEKLNDVKATLGQEMTSDIRSAQQKELRRLFENFQVYYPTTPVNMPQSSNKEEIYAYTLCTPLRDNRYVTGKGNGNELLGETEITKNSLWKFVQRTDSSYDIVNLNDGTYISPNCDYNTSLKSVNVRPEKGWSLLPADETGYLIITSGSTQFNQTNIGLGSKIYNWGSGDNMTDAGCKYRIEATEIPEEIVLPEPIYTQVDLRYPPRQTPFRLPDAIAQSIFGCKTSTVAIDYTLQSSTGAVALVSATDENRADSYLSYIIMDGNRYGIRYDDAGGWYTQSASVTGRHQIVIVANADNGTYRFFLDGSFGREVSGLTDSTKFLSLVNGANAIYVGGTVTSDNANKYPFIGTIHSVRFFDAALTDTQVAALDYTEWMPTNISLHSISDLYPRSIYDLSGRKVSCPENGIYIVDRKKILIP